MTEKRIRVDFHSHTHYSKDSLNNIQSMLNVCRQRGIDRLVITDHNTIQGAVKAQQLDPERVIMGEEIKTTRGEILAVYVQEEIPAGLSPIETINRLRSQGAFISVSHPFDLGRSGHWELEDLLEIAPLVDAIEIFNARCMRSIYNTQAQEFAEIHHLLGTAGSDAHSLMEIGKATLNLPEFHDPTSLKQAIQHARLEASLSPPWIHLTSRYAVWKKSIQNPHFSP